MPILPGDSGPTGWANGVNAQLAAIPTTYVPLKSGGLVHSLSSPSSPDAGAVINAELTALAAFGSGQVQLGIGALVIGTSIAIPAGCEVVGLGPRVTVLTTATDMPAFAFRGGAAQGIRMLSIVNAVAGARTAYDIDITNPTKPVLEDVEVQNSATATGQGGIRFFGTTLLGGENAFMPQLSRVWIRGARLVISGVTDGHFTDGYVWATNRTSGGAVDMSTASTWTFTSVDVVPPLGDGAGYALDGCNNINWAGGYVDGSYGSIASGYGVKANNSGLLNFSSYLFYNLGRSGILLTNTHGCSVGQVGFFNCNKNDASYPDIDLYGSTYNTFEGNTHTCYATRTAGGFTYREDGASVQNSVDNNTLDQTLGNTYASPYQGGAATTFGRRNRPGAYWARPAGTRDSYVPAASLLTAPGSAVAWPGANFAALHRFTVETGANYRYARFECGAASGNFQAAVIALSGTGFGTYTRVMNSGVVTATTGNVLLDMGLTFLPPGEYAIGLWASSTSSTFYHGSGSSPLVGMALAAQLTNAAGIPASGSITWNSDRYVAGLTLSYT